MKMSMRVEGGRELAATLRAMPKANARAAQVDALLEAGLPMLIAARSKAPRAPGYPDLADRIDMMQSRRKFDVTSDTETAVVIGPWKRRAFWGYFQEWGTAKHAAQPFLRPAFDENKGRSLVVLGRRLWENIQSWLQARDVR